MSMQIVSRLMAEGFHTFTDRNLENSRLKSSDKQCIR
ncbi:CLUMA_CG019532, isoform A [Clunio marinus]|uniref:CLUMA_CG019532, isoform A n=1 Tax=Clunio marinus TaxID=568069 RepID=A0A1J1J7Q9_9DIPT|nr:CLUMA_CG019532, isoform A [Clunio marinus]